MGVWPLPPDRGYGVYHKRYEGTMRDQHKDSVQWWELAIPRGVAASNWLPHELEIVMGALAKRADPLPLKDPSSMSLPLGFEG